MFNSKDTRPILIVIATVVLLIVIIWGVLIRLEKSTGYTIADSYSLIPQDAWLIFDLKNPDLSIKDFTDFFGYDNFMDKRLVSFTSYDTDSLKTPFAVFPFHPEITRGAPLVFSLHGSHPENPSVLFIVRTGNLIKTDLSPGRDLFTGSDFSVKSYPFHDAEISRVENAKGDKFYYSLFKGNLLFSESKKLLENSVTHYYSGNNINTQPDFQNVRTTSGRRVDNIFFDGARLCDIFSLAQMPAPAVLLPCNSPPGWIALDMIILDDEIRFSGISGVPSHRPSFLNALSGSPPASYGLFSYIPSSVIGFSLVSADSNQRFFTRWAEQVLGHEDQKSLKLPAKELFSANIHELADVKPFAPWFDSEPPAIYLLLLSGKTDPPDIDLLQDEAFDISLISLDTISDQKIYSDETGTWLSFVTNGVFPAEVNYIAIKDSVLLASRNLRLLKNYLGQLNFGQLIIDRQDFSVNFNFLQPLSNALYYKNIPSFFSPGSPSDENEKDISFYNIGRKKTLLNDLTFQFLSHNDSLFFFNAVISKSSPNRDMARASLQWQLNLDYALNTPPFRVVNHMDGSAEIMVQDNKNNLYLIDRFGSIIWKKEIPGQIISDFFQVDRYNNGRLQYIFNTRNYLHLIDRNGDYVSGFPVRLPSAATAGISVFDYEQNKNYRVMFPAENRKIYNFTVEGRQVRGWAEPETKEIVEREVQFLDHAGRHFIITVDIKGNPYFFNRRGIQRLTADTLKLLPSSEIYSVSGITGDVLAAMGSDGQIFKFFPEGNHSLVRSDSLNLPSGFKVVDNVNYPLRFIVANDKKIKGYNLSGEMMLNINTGEELLPELFCYFFEQKLYIGVISQLEGHLMLFDSSGKLMPGFPIPASDGFFIDTEMHADGTFLISGTGNTIGGYKFFDN